MKLDEQKKQVEICFSEYEALQEKHLSVLQSEEMPDLETMTIERAQVFTALQSGIDDLVTAATTGKSGPEDLSVLKNFSSQLNSIMVIDDKITGEIEKHKSLLKTNLNRVRKGQVAMNGYKNAGISSHEPRVVSMNK